MANTTQAPTDGAVIIDFPLDRVRTDEHINIQPTCMDCDHCYAGVRGLFCGFFSEAIIYDDIAEECPEFNPI